MKRTSNWIPHHGVTGPAADEGWTFLETVVVVAIILVLTATVGVSSMRLLDRARHAAAKNEIQLLSLALDSYYIDCRRYPTTQQGLAALWQEPIFEPIPSGWQGPYVMHQIGPDPWGTPFDYRAPGPSGLPYGIRSFGADGVTGGAGNDADVTSWEVQQ